MSITLYLSLTSSPSSPRVQINVPEKATGAELRKLASEATSIPLSTMKIIYRGRVIADKENGEVLTEYRLENDSVIHVMGKPVKSAEVPSPSASTTAAPTAAGASVTLPTTAAAAPATDASPLASALTTLRTSNSNEVYRTALSTADKLLKNIINHPMEEKYRTIKKANPAFNKRLGGVSGGEALLLASGFVIETVDGNEVYVLRPSAQAWPRLVAAGDEVARKVGEINAQSQSNNYSAPAPSMPSTSGGMPGMSGMPGMGGMPSGDMNAAMQQMMNDPNMMQNMMGMMNNPMVQNMMRNDPRFANNPMAQRALDELQNNPQMIQQVTQMMSDPTMRANMNRMMSQQQQSGAGGANPFGGGGGADEMRRQMEQFQSMSQQFGAGGASSTSNQSGNSGSNNGNAASDNEMTEEEMIAEAIRRSLGDS